jgi:hypothetical protein
MLASDDIHLDRCWSTNSPPFGWVNTLFHRKAAKLSQNRGQRLFIKKCDQKS